MVLYLRKAATFHSSFAAGTLSPSDEIPEASCMHPSQAHVEKKRAGSMFVVSSTVFRKQLVSLLAQNEYKQLETLQTLVVEHLTIEKKITKTILQR